MISVTIFVCFAYADRVQRLLGPGGTDIAVRLSAFILFCLSVQILWSCGSELLRSDSCRPIEPANLTADRKARSRSLSQLSSRPKRQGDLMRAASAQIRGKNSAIARASTRALILKFVLRRP